MWNIWRAFHCISRQYSKLQQFELELMEGNQNADFRTMNIHGPQREKFCDNKVITAKYNVFTFIPKSLWEQFHVYSNCFFLFIVILQQIPGVSPTGRFTTAVPLSFILLVSMIKQFFEDYRLHKSDNAVNNSLIYAFRHGMWVKVKWKELTVGDIVKVSENHMFPADLVLLASSEPEGMCYIRTSNLDGESNLKIRQAPPPKALIPDFENAGGASGLRPPPPPINTPPVSTNSNSETTADTESIATANRAKANKTAVATANAYAKFISSLRAVHGKIECEKPTRFLYDFTGSLRIDGAVPFPLNSDQLLLRGSVLKNTKWIIGISVYTGHETKIMLNAMLPSLKRSSIERLVNRQIISLFIILISLCLLSAIGNTIYNHLRLDKDWYLGFTRTWWKSNPNYKRGGFFGTKKYRVNNDPGREEPSIPNISEQYNYYNNYNNVGDEEYLIPINNSQMRTHVRERKYSELVTSNFGYIFLTFVILYNNLIPISLQVTVEVIRFFQAYFINVDADMYDNESKMYATARTSSLNEELGLIKYIFSDKTGTLTRNEMEFKKCSVGGKIYGNRSPDDTIYEDPTYAQDVVGNDEQSKFLRQFMTVLAVCHTVIPMNKKNKDSATPVIPEPMSPGTEPGTPGAEAHDDRAALTPDRNEGGGRQEDDDDRKLCGCVPRTSKQWVAYCPDIAAIFRSTVPSDGEFQQPDHPDELASKESSPAKPKKNGVGSPKKSVPKKVENYQGSSPDECALVEGAKLLGYDVVNREGGHTLTVNILGQEYQFEILNVLDFNSDRKRMTIVAKCPKGYLEPPKNPPAKLGVDTSSTGNGKNGNTSPATNFGDKVAKQSQEPQNQYNPDDYYSPHYGNSHNEINTQNANNNNNNNSPQNMPTTYSSLNQNNNNSNDIDDDNHNDKNNINNANDSADDYDLILMCKGADTQVYERVGDSEECARFKDQTLKDMETFAIEGLRTLCIAVAPVDKNFYKDWNKEYQEAKLAIKDREKKIDEVFDKIEKNFQLLGSTAIEDKLQEGVPETLTKLAQAGIKTWVLTGDKQETAINIGYSCALLTQDTPLLVINEETQEDVKNVLKIYKEQLGDRLRKDNRLALIINGKALKFALNDEVQHDFLDVILSCQTIICCRTTPLQKSEVVQLIRKNTTFSTLAVGDGSNDVAMIHAAHVGVGISGREGLQAANSSDFSISQFRFLTKLLLVHGSWCHSRMCKLILYQFYKNICMYIIELWFAIISYFSGQPLFERWTLGLYNVLFTALPPAAIGLFDRTCSAESCLRFPMLYSESQRAEVFNKRVFWMWIANAIIHSLLIFWFTFIMQMHDVVWSNGKTGDWLVLGNFIYTYVVIVVCLKSGLITYSWTVMTQIAIWGSILLWMIALVPYSYLWPHIPIAAEMSGEVTLIYSSYVFWLGIIIIPMITLAPDFLVKVFQRTLYPSLIEKVREMEIANQDPTDLITKATKMTIYWVLNKMFATLSMLDDQEDVKQGRPRGTSFGQRVSYLPLSLQAHMRKLSRLETAAYNSNNNINPNLQNVKNGSTNGGPIASSDVPAPLNTDDPTSPTVATAGTNGPKPADDKPKDLKVLVPGAIVEEFEKPLPPSKNGKTPPIMFGKDDIFAFNGGKEKDTAPPKTFDQLLLETPVPSKSPGAHKNGSNNHNGNNNHAGQITPPFANGVDSANLTNGNNNKVGPLKLSKPPTRPNPPATASSTENPKLHTENISEQTNAQQSNVATNLNADSNAPSTSNNQGEREKQPGNSHKNQQDTTSSKSTSSGQPPSSYL